VPTGRTRILRIFTSFKQKQRSDVKQLSNGANYKELKINTMLYIHIEENKILGRVPTLKYSSVLLFICYGYCKRNSHFVLAPPNFFSCAHEHAISCFIMLNTLKGVFHSMACHYMQTAKKDK
jgi:hypothetical protein